MSSRNRRKPPGLAINGILLLDKPAGSTSNGVLQQVKRLYGAAKAGHTGSLDPSATGMLPICFGHTTKLCGYLLESDKTYRVTGRLGSVTDTDDADGQVIETHPVPALSAADFSAVIATFSGKMQQRPPPYSALKRGGVRVHTLARQGIDVQLEPRPIEIFENELELFDGETFNLRLRVSKGTYIRSIVRDIGAKLGCGAHVQSLRRTAVAPFDANHRMYTIDDLEQSTDRQSRLLDTDEALSHYPQLQVSDDVANRFRNGAKPMLEHSQSALVSASSAEQDLLRIYTGDDNFLGLGSLRQGRLYTVRLMAG